MERFIIIKIEGHYVNPEGQVLMVKANRVEIDPELEVLSEMFERDYYMYSMEETDDTEIFLFPFSKELLDKMIYITKGKDEGRFWIPDMSRFYDSHLKLRDGSIKIIHKSLLFKSKR